MNRHHYRLIARVIQTSRANGHDMIDFASHLAAALEATQSNFDSKRFLTQCDPNGGNK